MIPKMVLIGPFSQIVTMRKLPARGALKDNQLEIISKGGLLVQNGLIADVGPFAILARQAKKTKIKIYEIAEPATLIPGFIDCHTHICFAGTRAKDYALRVAGTSYLEIAKQGGGILDTVRKTRKATLSELIYTLTERANRHLYDGVTTCEVKSGYGLTDKDEIKMLTAIARVNASHPTDLVPTVLAHIKPPEYADHASYLNNVANRLLPKVFAKGFAKRVDIFIEDGAFSPDVSRPFLLRAKSLGFDIVVHADQFGTGGSRLAAEVGALSADHLESTTETELALLAKSGVIAVALPGASLGLGMAFSPARKILDMGLSLAIASDWNPGSAPMGDLLMQAAVLGAAQKLTLAETLAALTVRAAMALKLDDRGCFATGQLADAIAFPTADYRDILYYQGRMKPFTVWKRGKKIKPRLSQ